MVEHEIEGAIDSTSGHGRTPAAPSASTACTHATSSSRHTLRALSLDRLRIVVVRQQRRLPGGARGAVGLADVVPIEPDGFNITWDCGSTEPAALCAGQEMRADIGIALDGCRPSLFQTSAPWSTATICWR